MNTDVADIRLLWFTRGVTIALIVVCNALLVLGWWVSGVNLETALSKPQIYDAQSNYCVRVIWMQVHGVDQPMKVCSEWLDLADPSGITHTLQPGHVLTVGADGHLQYEGQRDEDLRLVALALFVVVVIATGMWLKQYWIARYATYLQSAKGHAY